ncbi:MAG: Single-stranded DNA-binding protein [Parcubacteria group bacterium GW2011_GWE2_39_37]|uniref:Single-stranded DNA-binding protein n=1 Tax=Candidatus Falkowbacteria bacterium GW2011_GWF2_39_8 TaxID=1618642 RepID=A0A0G0Q0Z9_9BACT|nr:MAG: Single-stranded DNA-binding protein [Parcubacteria group bacterium GW2011_GWE2_39_37]KKR33808.1 MAG: Single-stranded DNA-binding protein [Candidatus Falkowbacteria bacterium GW2011_GWF2_39_8]
MNLNKAMIIGNLTRDPEVRNTPSGQSVASFSIATNQVWNDQSGQKQEKVEYHNIVVWRRLAEICGQYLHKGSKVYIEGRLQTRDWTGQDGIKRSRTEIIGENMIMLDKISSRESGGFNNEPPMPNEEPIININESNPDEDEIKVENIPF